MTDEPIHRVLTKAFPCLQEASVSVVDIKACPNLMESALRLPPEKLVPHYMIWCVEHEQSEEGLAVDNTIAVLNEFGRARHSGPSWLNFRFVCNAEQKAAVLAFLKWCDEYLELDYDPMLSRAIKRWQLATKAQEAT